MAVSTNASLQEDLGDRVNVGPVAIDFVRFAQDVATERCMRVGSIGGPALAHCPDVLEYASPPGCTIQSPPDVVPCLQDMVCIDFEAHGWVTGKDVLVDTTVPPHVYAQGVGTSKVNSDGAAPFSIEPNGGYYAVWAAYAGSCPMTGYVYDDDSTTEADWLRNWLA